MIYLVTAAFAEKGVLHRVVEAHSPEDAQGRVMMLGGQPLITLAAGMVACRILEPGRGYLGTRTLQWVAENAEVAVPRRKGEDTRPINMAELDAMATGAVLPVWVEEWTQTVSMALDFGAPAMRLSHGS